MNRRTLLAALPAAAVVPGAALAEAETPIVRLYREYNRITDAAHAHFEAGTGFEGKDEDEEMDRLFYNQRGQIEAEMMALPCTCAADFAAKVIVDTAQGSLYSDWNTGPLWAEARALIG